MEAKLRLDVDALAVDGFEAVETPAEPGTVAAHQDSLFGECETNDVRQRRCYSVGVPCSMHAGWTCGYGGCVETWTCEP